jgi:hypothetical protein
MAKLIPSVDLIGPVPAKKRNEFRTATLLAEYLPPLFKVFHSVHWATQNCDKTFLGEIDFIVLAPTGRLLLIEQKNGDLHEDKGGVSKLYRGQKKSVHMQMNRNLENLQTAFESRSGQKLDLDLLMYCPDYTVNNKAIAGIPTDRIVDFPKADLLPEIVRHVLDERALARQTCFDVEMISAFLSNQLHVRYDIGFLGSLAKSAYIEQAAGLSEWVGQMSGTPFRLLINATAGSGKTQLALDELTAAAVENKTALYVCFNRNFAEDMKKATGRPDTCTTFHELARVLYESKGFEFNPSNDGFSRSADYFAEHADEFAASVDVLLIDEAQDFDESWLENLFKLCKASGRLIVLMDEHQRLYSRAHGNFDGWIKIDHQISYRCPRIVTDHINEFGLAADPIVSRSVVEGLPTLLEYYESGDIDSLIKATELVVKQLVAEGHVTDEIAVLTVKGAESSELLKQASLGQYSFNKIIGRTTAGDFEYSGGEILADTVFRFKGRSANCVVLTELDFEDLDENRKRRLFVGLTRARLRLALVMSKSAAKLLIGEVEN